MKTEISIKKEAIELQETIDATISKNKSINGDIYNKIVNAPNVDTAIDIINNFINTVNVIYSAPSANYYVLPNHIYHVTYYGDSVNDIKVNITIRTKLKEAYKYVKKASLNVQASFFEDVNKTFSDALFEMFYIENARNNLIEVNQIIADICKENDIPYKFSFTVNGSGSSIVESISDEEVVFIASLTNALGVSSLGICAGGNEYNDYVRSESIDKLVSALSTVPTTTQLVKAKVPLIKSIVGATTKKRAAKIIRGAYHKNARYINKQKAGVAYYNETVDINGEEVNVFSIVEKTDDGSIKVVLTPFNTETLANVDFDVVSAIKEF